MPPQTKSNLFTIFHFLARVFLFLFKPPLTFFSAYRWKNLGIFNANELDMWFCLIFSQRFDLVFRHQVYVCNSPQANRVYLRFLFASELYDGYGTLLLCIRVGGLKEWATKTGTKREMIEERKVIKTYEIFPLLGVIKSNIALRGNFNHPAVLNSVLVMIIREVRLMKRIKMKI